jgi:N-acetylglucosaminyldiphosphoundecaprenol N-acetyl-beta-D-mannosaminyltransferase
MTAMETADREIFGLKLSDWNTDEIVSRLVQEPLVEGQGPRPIYTVNLDHVVHLTRRPDLLPIYQNAWIVTADGFPVVLYARSRGIPLPGRVTGADLFSRLMARLSPQRHRCAFLASSADTAARLEAQLVGRGFDRSHLLFVVPPFGFERDESYSAELAARISAFGATHLFMGVGAPKSEIWVHRHRDALGDCYVLSAGAGLDFAAGTRTRAPQAFQAIGMEWFWRFCQEPRRLFRRYFVDSRLFLVAVIRDMAALAR